MAIALVASVEMAPGPNGGTSGGIDTTGADLLVVTVSSYVGASVHPSITDSKGNTWTGLTVRAASSNARVRIFYAVNPTVGSGHTFTASGSLFYPAVTAAAFSGVKTTSPFDQENGATASGVSSLSTGSVTPSEGNELLVAVVCTDNTFGTLSIGSSFTKIQDQEYGPGQNMAGGSAYLVQGGASAVNPQWSWTGSREAAAAIATFKSAAGGGGGTAAPWHYYHQMMAG